MAVNKITVNGEGIDLSEDSVQESSLLEGETAHNRYGLPIVGELKIQRYYTGSSEPSSALGSEGDLYLLIEG